MAAATCAGAPGADRPQAEPGGMRSVVLGFLGLLLAPLALTAAGAAEVTLDRHGGPVKGIAVAADGRRALTASFDYSLILWDLPHQAAIRQLYGHQAAVNAAAFLPGGEAAVSASDDGTVALWDLATGRLLARLTGHQGKVTALAVSPDGRLAASAAWVADSALNKVDLPTLGSPTIPQEIATGYLGERDGVRYNAASWRATPGHRPGTRRAAAPPGPP